MFWYRKVLYLARNGSYFPIPPERYAKHTFLVIGYVNLGWLMGRKCVLAEAKHPYTKTLLNAVLTVKDYSQKIKVS